MESPSLEEVGMGRGRGERVREAELVPQPGLSPGLPVPVATKNFTLPRVGETKGAPEKITLRNTGEGVPQLDHHPLAPTTRAY